MRGALVKDGEHEVRPYVVSLEKPNVDANLRFALLG